MTLSTPAKMCDDVSVWKEASRKTLAKGTDSAAHLPGLLTFVLPHVSSHSLVTVDEVLQVEQCLTTMRLRALG